LAISFYFSYNFIFNPVKVGVGPQLIHRVIYDVRLNTPKYFPRSWRVA